MRPSSSQQSNSFVGSIVLQIWGLRLAGYNYGVFTIECDFCNNSLLLLVLVWLATISISLLHQTQPCQPPPSFWWAFVHILEWWRSWDKIKTIINHITRNRKFKAALPHDPQYNGAVFLVSFLPRLQFSYPDDWFKRCQAWLSYHNGFHG